MNSELLIVLLCGVLALLYGAWTIRSVLSLSAGNARMQEIAAAIQEGARAYLNRQYTTIAMVGVVIFVLACWFLGWQLGVGFLIGAVLSGLAGSGPSWGYEFASAGTIEGAFDAVEAGNGHVRTHQCRHGLLPLHAVTIGKRRPAAGPGTGRLK